jgi:hypothetical protein
MSVIPSDKSPKHQTCDNWFLLVKLERQDLMLIRLTSRDKWCEKINPMKKHIFYYIQQGI